MGALGPQICFLSPFRPEGVSVTGPDLTGLCWASVWLALQAQGSDIVHFKVPVSGGPGHSFLGCPEQPASSPAFCSLRALAGQGFS